MVSNHDPTMAQASVLGSILLEPDLMGEALQQLRDDDFSDGIYRLCWTAMRKIWNDGKQVDPVLLLGELNGTVNARQFVVELMEIVPTAKRFGEYLPIVKRLAAEDRLRQIGAALQGAADLDEQNRLLEEAQSARISKQSRDRRNSAGMLHSFGARHSAKESPRYLPWGMGKLDSQLTCEQGDYIIIGGRPSDGKTALALFFAWVQAKTMRVGFYSFETNVNKLEDRSLAMMAGIDLQHIKHNCMTQAEWEAYSMHCSDLSQRNLDIIQAAGMTVEDIRADALAHRYDVIYVDYLQLISPSNPKESNRYTVVTDISLRLHQLSQGTGITVIALCQLNRPQEGKDKKTREPRLTDLRESGQIEQDADVVLFIYRTDGADANSQRKLFCAKNKEGTLGRFGLAFDGKYQRFREAEPMPPAKGTHRSTPVIGTNQTEPAPEQYSFLTGDDPELPFQN